MKRNSDKGSDGAAASTSPDPFTRQVMIHAHAARRAAARGDVALFNRQLQGLMKVLTENSQAPAEVVERS